MQNETLQKESLNSKEKEYLSLVSENEELKRLKSQRIKSSPLKFYWPHTENCDGTQCHTVSNTYTDAYGIQYTIKGCPQYFFHISDADVRCFFGSNRSGKTTAGIVESSFHLTGIYPDWYPIERRYSEPVKSRILANDFKKAVGEVITEAIDDWLPDNLVHDKDKNSQGIYDKYWIKHKSGGVSSFDIITYEQDVSVAEGWSGHFAWYDEPPPRGHRIATARGLMDYDGWEIFTLTPLKEAWIFDELWSQ
ncbi:unnamed protein product, partial [marine sediment metagenome]